MKTLIALVLFIGMSAAAAEVKVENGRLMVDGKPFFFISASGVYDSLEAMKSHHFNTIFAWKRKNAEAAATELPRYGFMFMPFIQCTKFKREGLLAFVEAFRDCDNILAWNIGDDLSGRDAETIEEAARIIREADDKHRPIALDTIHEEWKVAHVPDIYGNYYYPLLKVKWTPKAYREFIERGVRRPEYRVTLHRNQVRWTWLQVHTQTWYTNLVHGGPERAHIGSRFPNPEHIRLFLHEALAGGCKGIIYYSYLFFAPDWYGRGRWGEVGVLNCELDAFGPLLADSDMGEALKTNREDVFARAFRGPFGMLIILTVERDFYQFHLDEAVAGDVEVELPQDAPTASALLLQFPEPKTLRREGNQLIVPRVEIASVILLPARAEIADEICKKYASLLPDAARFSFEAAKGTYENMQPIFRFLKENDSLAEGCEALWEDVGKRINAAERLLQSREHARSFEAGREALRLMRTIQYKCWRKFVGDELPDYHDWRKIYLLCFYDLPMYVRLQRARASLAHEKNLVPNPSFEQMKDNQPVAWSEQSAATTRARRISTDRAYDGANSYNLSSAAPTVWRGEEHDWVTIDATSDLIPVEPNSYYEIGGYIYIPKDFQKTERGATVGVLRFDEKGKLIKGTLIEAGDAKSTEGWKKVSIFFDTRGNVRAVKARIAVCGIGEAYFDCIELKKIPFPAE